MAKEVVWATDGGFRITSECNAVLYIHYDKDTSLLLTIIATSIKEDWAVKNHTQISFSARSILSCTSHFSPLLRFY